MSDFPKAISYGDYKIAHPSPYGILVGAHGYVKSVKSEYPNSYGYKDDFTSELIMYTKSKWSPSNAAMRRNMRDGVSFRVVSRNKTAMTQSDWGYWKATEESIKFFALCPAEN